MKQDPIVKAYATLHPPEKPILEEMSAEPIVEQVEEIKEEQEVVKQVQTHFANMLREMKRLKKNADIKSETVVAPIIEAKTEPTVIKTEPQLLKIEPTVIYKASPPPLTEHHVSVIYDKHGRITNMIIKQVQKD